MTVSINEVIKLANLMREVSDISGGSYTDTLYFCTKAFAATYYFSVAYKGNGWYALSRKTPHGWAPATKARASKLKKMFANIEIFLIAAGSTEKPVTGAKPTEAVKFSPPVPAALAATAGDNKEYIVRSKVQMKTSCGDFFGYLYVPFGSKRLHAIAFKHLMEKEGITIKFDEEEEVS